MSFAHGSATRQAATLQRAVLVLDSEGDPNVADEAAPSFRHPWLFAVDLGRRITRHHTLLLASGVAFSSVLGLIPALVAVVSVYGLVAAPEDVESNLRPLTTALPQDAADLIVSQLRNVTQISSPQVTVGLITGLIGVMWAISNAVNAVVMAIRVAHEIPSPHTWVQGRLFALKLSVIAVLATTTSIWLVAALPNRLGRFGLTDDLSRLIDIARFPAVIATSALSIAVLYRAVVGDRSGRYRFMSIGAISGTVIWVASTIGLSTVYTSIDQLNSTFGSIGAVAALMVWFYLSAVAVLVGAEIDGLRHQRDHLDG